MARRGIRQGSQSKQSLRAQDGAKRWEAQKRLELEAQAELGHNPVPMEKAMSRYINEVAPTKKGARTEIIRGRRLMRSWLANMQTDKITPADIQKWKDERLKQVQETTVRREMTTLSCVFNACVDWGYCPENPVKKVKRPKEAPPRDRRICKAPKYLDTILHKIHATSAIGV